MPLNLNAQTSPTFRLHPIAVPAGWLPMLAAGCLLLAAWTGTEAEAQIRVVRPQPIDDVLNNPGIGFMTFQRFNGDDLNSGTGWTEGFPIEYQPFDGDLSNPDHPDTRLAYFRVNWRFIEPEPQQYRWDLIDKALLTASQRGQTLLLRISPYEGDKEKDVPAWYRDMVGDEGPLPIEKWRVNPENPLYLRYFGGLIRALGERYDGHPALEAVDVSIVGYWGEGEGSHLLQESTWQALVWTYLESFRKTHLIFQPLNGDAPDPGILVRGLPISATWPGGLDNGTGPHMRNLGWRIDCLGDMGFWKERGGWNHMQSVYPQDIIRSGMQEAWKEAPVTMEICGTFLRWKEREGYTEEVVRYIFDQALKWHVSSFNAKSSPVPEEWRPLVDEWLKKMGYRLILRQFSYPETVRVHSRLAFKSWWDNVGVAPCYRAYPLALRLRGAERTEVLVTDADIRQWLPGDSLYDDAVFIPADLAPGEYELELALVDPGSREPAILLAVAGRRADGWYTLGSIKVEPAE